MAKHLVIVESPAKAKTIGKYLGKDYQVAASIGHVRDLPSSKLSVDIENDFAPQYKIIDGKEEIVSDLKKAAKNKKSVLLASDPDREGEAIAWHLSYLLTEGKDAIKAPIKRVLFEEITKPAVLAAIEKPREVKQSSFESQQARRILDRIVGYKISPVLWEKVKRGLSAGRVQTVALRIVCEREREIRAFNPVEYWSIRADLEGKNPPPFEAGLYSYKGERVTRDAKGRIGDGKRAIEIVNSVTKASFTVSAVDKSERQRKPVAPFTTSRLQQEASRRLGWQPKRTMQVAQRLYEGIDVGDPEGPVGLITYMRTDSTRVAPQALDEVRGFIGETFGKQYLPSAPNEYKSGKSAQEAHEAIRPTSALRTPESIKSFLEPEHFRLYELIWKRFVASQMVPARFDQTTISIGAAECVFRATGQVMKFDGFMHLYIEGKDDERKKDGGEAIAEDDDSVNELPQLSVGEVLKLIKVTPNQHFTEPPPRFSQATLIKELEEKGIGRPSTYASIMGTILNREYVNLDQSKRLVPTELGLVVADMMVKAFPREFEIAFTAEMEEKLDQIEEQKIDWVKMLRDFYGPFEKNLEVAPAKLEDVKIKGMPTNLTCQDCGSPLVIRFGKNGEFLACTKYPDCKFTADVGHDDKGQVLIKKDDTVPAEEGTPCPKCEKPTVIRRGRFGPFKGCSGYPDCDYIESIKKKSVEIGFKCPDCKEGEIVQRRSRWGKFFYGCSRYKKEGGCTFASNYRPIAKPCPVCKSEYLLLHERKRGNILTCPKDGCEHEEAAPATQSTDETTAAS